LSDTNGCNRESVPEGLKALPRGLCWRYEERAGKTTKVPYHARSGRQASVTEPSSWADFETAAAASGRCDRLGIVLGGGLSGRDLDNSVDGAGNLKPRAKDIVERIDSYTERCRSGRSSPAARCATLARLRTWTACWIALRSSKRQSGETAEPGPEEEGGRGVQEKLVVSERRACMAVNQPRSLTRSSTVTWRPKATGMRSAFRATRCCMGPLDTC